MKFRAAVLEQLNKPLVIRELEVPPLQFGQVLVKIKQAGICGSQLSEIKGWKGNERFLPHLMGHEGYGEVCDTGFGITKVKIGDNVVLHWRKGSGIEADFPKYGNVGAGKVATFAEYSIVSENRLTKVEDIPADFGCLLGCALTTGFGAVNHEAKVKIGEKVLVLGCGSVGLSVIKGCSLAGAIIHSYDIIDKTLYTSDNGCDTFYDNKECIKNHRYDAIFDTVANPKLLNTCIHQLNDGGRYVLLGQPAPDTIFNLDNIYKIFGGESKSIVISQGGSTNPDIDIPHYINLWMYNRMNYKTIISSYYDFDSINGAIEHIKNGRCYGKAIITI